MWILEEGNVTLIAFSNKLLKSSVQKRPWWRFWTNLHKTSKLSTFLQCYSSQIIVSCSQRIVLVIWIESPPKLYQVTLLLARKVKLPKCQEIPIISAGGKKQFCCCPWWMWLKKKIANLTCSNGLPRQEKLFQKLFTLQNGKFCFTGNSQLSHLFRLATPSLPGSTS